MYQTFFVCACEKQGKKVAQRRMLKVALLLVCWSMMQAEGSRSKASGPLAHLTTTTLPPLPRAEHHRPVLTDKSWVDPKLGEVASIFPHVWQTSSRSAVRKICSRKTFKKKLLLVTLQLLGFFTVRGRWLLHFKDRSEGPLVLCIATLWQSQAKQVLVESPSVPFVLINDQTDAPAGSLLVSLGSQCSTSCLCHSWKEADC